MTSKADRPDAVVLIVVRSAVVSMDLAQTVAEDWPGARIVITSSCTEALEELAEVPTVDMAFVTAQPETFEGSELSDALHVRGSRVVLMGGWFVAQPYEKRWSVLPLPFTTDDVSALMMAG